MDNAEKAGIAVVVIAVGAFIVYYLYKNSPMGKIGTGLSNLLSGLSGTASAGTQIQQDVSGIYNEIAGIGTTAAKDMSKGMASIGAGWTAATNTVQSEFGKVQQGFTSLGSDATNVVKSVGSTFATDANIARNALVHAGTGTYKAFSSAIAHETKSIQSGWTGATSAISNTGKTVANDITGIGSSIANAFKGFHL